MTVSIHNMRFFYDDSIDTPVLDIPQWTVSAGEHVFIHGPSGSGKSTLLNLLAGVLVAPEGVIKILDKQLDKMTGRQRDKFRANHIGFVFQQFNLIPYLTVLDNIRIASHFSTSSSKRGNIEQQAAALLQALHIEPALHHRHASRLSIGQQQRVAIARALINTPELLIVDEPTSALDSQNRDAFMSLLMERVTDNNITLIFVSHDTALSNHFSRIVPLQEINQAGGRH